MFKAIEYQKCNVYLCTYKGLCAIFAKWTKKECWGLYTVQKKKRFTFMPKQWGADPDTTLTGRTMKLLPF